MTKVATVKVPGGTIVRVETDADGNAAYEAHMTKADGSLVTIYVDKSFNVVSVRAADETPIRAGAARPPTVPAPSLLQPRDILARGPFPELAQWTVHVFWVSTRGVVRCRRAVV